MAYSWYPSTWEIRQEDKKFNVTFDYNIASLRAAWDTQETLSQKQKQNRELNVLSSQRGTKLPINASSSGLVRGDRHGHHDFG